MKRILVGLDGSPSERQVLDTAVALAAKIGGKLVLFRAVTLPRELPPRALALPPAQVGALLTEAAQQHLDELARGLRAEVVERTQVATGVPWRAVCDAAREDEADLVVVGSHGYGGIDRLIGTNAAKIVNHAHCSVLVTRDAV